MTSRRRPSDPCLIAADNLTTRTDSDTSDKLSYAKHRSPVRAAGFLVKEAAPADLLDGIRRAATGERPFSPDVLHRLVESAVAAHSDAEDQTGAPPAQYALTHREADVVALLTEGLSNAEIAARLVLGVTTVKTHVTNLMAKTGSPKRVRLATYGLRHGAH